MMMKQYGVLACLSLLCLSACDCGSRQAVLQETAVTDVIILPPEKVFEIKVREAVDVVWERLGPAMPDESFASEAYFYELAPKGRALLCARGDGSFSRIASVFVTWSSDAKGNEPVLDQYWEVEYEGAPYEPTVPLSDIEKSRRHVPSPFVHLVGLSRDEAAAEIGVKPDDLAGDVVRFRLDPRGFADVHIKPDDRVAAVELIWEAQAGDDGGPRRWPAHLSGNAESDRTR